MPSEASTISEQMRQAFARVLVNQRPRLIATLNQNGFSLSSNSSNDEIIIAGLQGINVSNQFRNDFAQLIVDENKREHISFGQKKGFVEQPVFFSPPYFENDATKTIYDMRLNPCLMKEMATGGFLPAEIFADQKNMMNADGNGGFFSGVDFGDVTSVLTTGLGAWTTQQQIDAANKNAQAALDLERLKILEAQKAIELSNAQAANTGKKWVTPMIVAGVLAIAGIAAYFYFKKKK